MPHHEVPEWFDRADILVNSSRIDNMPHSLIEAFAAGMPVVTTPAGGIPYVVEDHRNGLFAAVDDPDAMAGAVLRLLDDPALARRLVDEGAEDCDRALRLESGAAGVDEAVPPAGRGARSPPAWSLCPRHEARLPPCPAPGSRARPAPAAPPADAPGSPSAGGTRSCASQQLAVGGRAVVRLLHRVHGLHRSHYHLSAGDRGHRHGRGAPGAPLRAPAVPLPRVPDPCWARSSPGRPWGT